MNSSSDNGTQIVASQDVHCASGCDCLCTQGFHFQIPTAIATLWEGLFLIKSAHFGVFAHYRQSSTS